MFEQKFKFYIKIKILGNKVYSIYILFLILLFPVTLLQIMLQMDHFKFRERTVGQNWIVQHSWCYSFLHFGLLEAFISS